MLGKYFLFVGRFRITGRNFYKQTGTFYPTENRFTDR